MADEVEAQITRQLEAGDAQSAATVALEAYGPEILGFIAGMERDPSAQREVFSMFCEDLWRGLAKFEGRSRFRTWSYAVARNAVLRFKRDRNRAQQRSAEFNESRLSKVADRVRESTAPYMRTDVKDKFRALRERLEADDQMLLILRVDRKLAWNQVAEVMAEAEAAPETLKTRAAALRKRFERVKAHLRKLAIEEGLVPTSEEAP